MKIEDLGNGYSRLTAEGGVLDTRNGRIYSSVTVRNNDIRYFKAAEEGGEQ